MATFKGTREEFHRFVSPRYRQVTQRLGKSIRANGCYVCGETSGVVAAHRPRHSRKAILERLTGMHEDDDGKAYTVDLGRLENDFIAAHTPPTKVMVSLCPECHLATELKVGN